MSNGYGTAHAKAGAQSSKSFLEFGISTNFFCRLSASLPVIWKREIAILKRHKLRAHYVGDSACASRGPEWAKFPGTLESAITFSPDSRQAYGSFASVRSRSQIVTNFAHFS